MKTGIELIAEERREQIEKHGFSLTDDAKYSDKKQLHSAAVYALTYDDKYYPEDWGFWWKNKMEDKRNRMVIMTPEFEIERLKIAGALIAAEIDRLTSK